MTEKQNESISALMDGELDEMSLHRLLKGDDEKAITETWSRYHMARDAMKGEANEFMSLDISASVSVALEDEAPLNQNTFKEKAASWWKPVAGLSVAASVAFAVIVGARFGADGFAPQAEIAASVAGRRK